MSVVSASRKLVYKSPHLASAWLKFRLHPRLTSGWVKVLPKEPDRGLASVLRWFGVHPDDLLGSGDEATVYALGGDRVLRVLHAHSSTERFFRRQHLVSELSRARPPFALPEVLEVGEYAGRVFSIERPPPGRTVLDALKSSSGKTRCQLIERHLEAAAALGDLFLEPRDTFGDLILEDAIITSTWREYLAERAAVTLAQSPRDFWSIDPVELAEALPEPAAPAFVDLDTWAGHMLTDGSRITAVIDISLPVAGDRRMNPLLAAIWLASPEITTFVRKITPVVQPMDIDVALSWLRAAGLYDWLDPAWRWVAALWSAHDDQNILRWCRRILLDHS